MGDLNCFLAQNAVKTENVRYAASKRYHNKAGKPMEWEIGTLGSTEDEALRKDCTKRIPVPGRRGQYTQETDYTLYVGRLAAACTVFPNLNDKELQDSYHVMGADALLKAMLTAGEYASYLEKVQQVNGFDTTMEDMVDEAKN